MDKKMSVCRKGWHSTYAVVNKKNQYQSMKSILCKDACMYRVTQFPVY